MKVIFYEFVLTMLLWVGYGWVDLVDLFFFVKVQFHQYSTIKKVCS